MNPDFKPIEFDWNGFKIKAKQSHFFGTVELKLNDGDLVLVQVVQQFKVKDLDNKFVAFTNGLI
jgi:hypothetical protein